MKKYTHLTSAACGLAMALLATPALKADLSFHIDIDTSSLGLAPNGPFLLDFQLNEGSGSLANSVTLNQFVFNGGVATGTPSLFGNASGNLDSSVLLTENTASPFAEFFQGFSAGTTGIQFNGTISQNSPGFTPDEFAVSILDSETNFPQIATTAPDGVSLVTFDIDSSNTLSDFATFSSASPQGVTTSVGVPVPESSTMGIAVAIFALGLAGFRRFFRRSEA